MCVSADSKNTVQWKLVKGSVDSPIFLDFLQTLKLQKNATIVMDNAKIHHATNSLISLGLPSIKMWSMVNQVNMVYLPPYSPEFAPVETDINFTRTLVNKTRPMTEFQLRNSISNAVKKITPEHILNSYNHCWIKTSKI